MQSQKSVESFGWQWTKQAVFDSTRTLHKRLFKRWGIWFDHLDGKVVAEVCSGNGRHSWGLNRLTKAKKIISIELADAAVEYQKEAFKNEDRIEVVQADVGNVKFQADFIYFTEGIQHVSDAEGALKNIYENLNEQGEMVITFYFKSLATMALEPIRFILKNFPKRIRWWISPFLAPLFMFQLYGRENGFQNARLIAYDWFGGHEFQRYFTDSEVLEMFAALGIEETNIIQFKKGCYKIRRGKGLKIDDTLHSFGGESKREN
jgi:ubiquinone/menaquinone biosynthesis C-methylase UbiE